LEKSLEIDNLVHRQPEFEVKMNAFKAAILAPLVWTSLLCAGDFSSYRGFTFGTSLEAAQKQIGASEAKLVHQRPAVIQELNWWPRSPYRQEDAKRIDPLREGLLRFYNGELFKIIATYEQQSVEGMTEADLVEAISQSVYLPGNNRGYEPVQPIAYSHRLHAGELALDCKSCHVGAETSRTAGIPSANVCMNCHRFVQAASNDLRVEEAAAKAESRAIRPIISPELRKLFKASGWGENGKPDSSAEARPLPWVKVHDLPDFVYFNHARHVNGGVECRSCHGAVETMERVRQVENFSMGFCVNCHRAENTARGKLTGEKGWASLDCSACHTWTTASWFKNTTISTRINTQLFNSTTWFTWIKQCKRHNIS